MTVLDDLCVEIHAKLCASECPHTQANARQVFRQALESKSTEELAALFKAINEEHDAVSATESR